MNLIKKIGIILTTCLFVSTLNAPVFAKDLPLPENDPNSCSSCNEDNEPRNIDYGAIAQYQYLSEIAEQFNAREAQKNPFGIRTRAANAYVTAQGWASDGIVRYYQTDYNDLLCPKSGGTSTIASAGCVITSFAMIANKYKFYMTPPQVLAAINSNSPGSYSGCNFPWYDIVNTSPFTSLLKQDITSTVWSSAYDNMEGALLSGRPVLAFMKASNGSTHAVVVYGFERYSDGGEFHYIFNPDPRNASHQVSLEEYQRDGWKVNRLMVYYK